MKIHQFLDEFHQEMRSFHRSLMKFIVWWISSLMIIIIDDEIIIFDESHQWSMKFFKFWWNFTTFSLKFQQFLDVISSRFDDNFHRLMRIHHSLLKFHHLMILSMMKLSSMKVSPPVLSPFYPRLPVFASVLPPPVLPPVLPPFLPPPRFLPPISSPHFFFLPLEGGKKKKDIKKLA